MRLAVACVLAALVVAPPVLAADTHPPASSLADALQGPAKDAYDSGKLLAANGDFAGALLKFQLAYDTSHNPRLLFNLAVCSKELHRYAKMQSLLRRYEEEAGASLSSEEKARADAALGAIAPLIGRVHLVANVEGANVSVDGETAGATPLIAPLPLDLGKHSITVERAGYAPFTATVDVSGGNDTDLPVMLAQVTHAGHLVVHTAADATVSIDGGSGATGRLDTSLPSGSHTVRVSAPGRLEYQKEVVLADGETRTMDVTLELVHHAAAWPWVVGGAALVAAGAVVGGYFLFRPDSQSGLKPGTFGTGQATLQSIRW